MRRTPVIVLIVGLSTLLGACGREDGEISVGEKAAPPATVDLPDSIPARELVVTLDGDTYMSGDLPLMVDMYSESGDRASPGGLLTGDLRDAVLDLSALEKGAWVPVALQEAPEYLAAVCAGAPKIVIMPDGFVYPLGDTTMAATGPYVRLELLDGKWNQIDPKSLTISAAQGSEAREYSIHDNLVVISGISPEPIRLEVSDGPDTNEIVVFPYVRASNPQLVGYRIHSITIGDLLPETK